MNKSEDKPMVLQPSAGYRDTAGKPAGYGCGVYRYRNAYGFAGHGYCTVLKFPTRGTF
jgi:hypothetical protein